MGIKNTYSKDDIYLHSAGFGSTKKLLNNCSAFLYLNSGDNACA